MYMFGFTDEAFSVAFYICLKHKALGIAYVTMSETHYVLWLRTFLAKHYYNVQ